MNPVDVYKKAVDGSFFRCDQYNYWLKPEQIAEHHLEGMLINLFNGRLLHCSKVENLTVIDHNEIMW
jgi:hypothetical protein